MLAVYLGMNRKTKKIRRGDKYIKQRKLLVGPVHRPSEAFQEDEREYIGS